jgi:hypothetical protein
MRAKIETILDDFASTIKYNTDISPEEAYSVAVDSIMMLIKENNL